MEFEILALWLLGFATFSFGFFWVRKRYGDWTMAQIFRQAPPPDEALHPPFGYRAARAVLPRGLFFRWLDHAEARLDRRYLRHQVPSPSRPNHPPPVERGRVPPPPPPPAHENPGKSTRRDPYVTTGGLVGYALAVTEAADREPLREKVPRLLKTIVVDDNSDVAGTLVAAAPTPKDWRRRLRRLRKLINSGDRFDQWEWENETVKLASEVGLHCPEHPTHDVALNVVARVWQRKVEGHEPGWCDMHRHKGHPTMTTETYCNADCWFRNKPEGARSINPSTRSGWNVEESPPGIKSVTRAGMTIEYAERGLISKSQARQELSECPDPIVTKELGGGIVDVTCNCGCVHAPMCPDCEKRGLSKCRGRGVHDIPGCAFRLR